MWAVTARHVIDGLRGNGVKDIFLRTNSKTDHSGAPPMRIESTSIDKWYAHPTDTTIDVAICEMGIAAEVDQLVIPRNRSITPATWASQEVGLGDEVFVAGLFHHHFGKRRNIPIVRIGNLIALNEERVETRMGDIDAYLIECRSIGGLSGSPVFLNLGVSRSIEGQVKHSTTGQPITYLLGLMHGHFDVPADELDLPSPSEKSDAERINAGVGIVVPCNSILAVIDEYERQYPAA